jgi:hypothetical protein
MAELVLMYRLGSELLVEELRRAAGFVQFDLFLCHL